MPDLDSTPPRLLPFDVDFGQARIIGDEASSDRPPNPPRYAELLDAGLIAPVDDPDRSFEGKETATAVWLRQSGLVVLSIKRRTGNRERTPDAALPEHEATVELKRTVASVTAIVRAIRLGRGQSRRVAVDIRGQGAEAALAMTGIATAVRFYGEHLDEIIVVVSDDQSVGWWHGRDAGSE